MATKKTNKEIFTDIYTNNRWMCDESRSGLGSTMPNTKLLRESLSPLVNDLEVFCILDVGCGDHWWMRNMLFETQVEFYMGYDVVGPLIDRNKKLYEVSNSVVFEQHDVVDPNVEMPGPDMIVCRDVMMHLSLADAEYLLNKVIASGARYLAATTFPSIKFPRKKENEEIETGQWRPLNLRAWPFMLPQPIESITENNPYRLHPPKELAIWDLDAIREGEINLETAANI